MKISETALRAEGSKYCNYLGYLICEIEELLESRLRRWVHYKLPQSWAFNQGQG